MIASHNPCPASLVPERVRDCCHMLEAASRIDVASKRIALQVTGQWRGSHRCENTRHILQNVKLAGLEASQPNCTL